MPKLTVNSPPAAQPQEIHLARPAWGQSGETGRELPLSYYWSWIRRSCWWIITFVLLVTAVCTLVAMALPKQYQAVAVIRVDPVGQHVIGDTGQGSQNSVDSTLLMTTESQIIASPAIVLSTIDKLHLENVPQFATPASELAGMSAAERTDRLIKAVTQRIGVQQPVQTYLLDVQFTAHDPNIAAAVANSLAQSFLDHEYTTRAKALTDSTRYMADQLDSLRAQAERDQTALVNYESSHDVIDADDKTNIYSDRLNQINTDLSQAVSARMKLEADDEIARSGNIDALLISDRGAALIPLHDHLLAERQKLAQMGTIYGTRHPLYLQQERVVAQAGRALSDEANHIRLQVDDEYQRSQARESLIQSGLTQEKAAMDAFNLRAINYHALKAASDSSTTLYYDLQRQIQDATVAAGLRSEDLRLIGPARVPYKPASPKPLLVAVLAALVSTLLACGVVVGLSLRDRTVSDPEQVESIYGVAAVGGLPFVSIRENATGLGLAAYRAGRDGSNAGAPSRRSPYHEAILSLHTALQFLGPEPVSTLAVTSAVPGEGKSTATCHLAAAYAALGTRVVLIDADLRKPSVHRVLGISNQVGLASVLQGDVSLDQALMDSGPAGFTVLTSGPVPAAPSELLHLGIAKVIGELRLRYDRILIDCPPVLGFADSAWVASECEGVLLVVQAGSTDQSQISASVRALKAVRANLMGIVLNRVAREANGYYSYYKNEYYSNYSTEDDGDD